MIHAMRKSVASVAKSWMTNGMRRVDFSRRQEREAAVGRFVGVRFLRFQAAAPRGRAAPKPQVLAKVPARPSAAGGLASILFLYLFLNLYRCWASVDVNPEELPRHPRSFTPIFLLTPEELRCRTRNRRELPRHPRTRRLELPRQPRIRQCDLPPQPRTTPICVAWRARESHRGPLHGANFHVNPEHVNLYAVFDAISPSHGASQPAVGSEGGAGFSVAFA